MAEDALAAEVLAALQGKGLTMATAESLTGGLLAGRVTSVPGASRVFRGGVVAYATDLKHQLLGVDADLLARVGAVHPAVAAAMAAGVCERLGADVGIATTGVAGPDPQDGQQAGTVFVGLCISGRSWQVDVSQQVDDPSRSRAWLRAVTCEAALRAVRHRLLAEGPAGEGPAGEGQEEGPDRRG